MILQLDSSKNIEPQHCIISVVQPHDRKQEEASQAKTKSMAEKAPIYPFTQDGTHQQCCREWAARGWTAGHDRVVDAIAQEASRAGLSASTNNALLRSRFSHLHNGQHADCVVNGGDSLPVKDTVARIGQSHSKHLFDVRIACPVTTNNIWKVKPRSANGIDPFLTEVEAEKYEKHETPYAQMGLGFLAFAVSSFCVLGPTLLRYLAILANLKVSKYRAFREQYQLTELPASHATSLQSQYLSVMFAHVCDATAKATFMRLCGRDNPPLAQSFQRVNLDHLHPPSTYAYHIAQPARSSSSRHTSALPLP